MSKDAYLDRLRAVPMFAALSKKELAAVLRAGGPLQYPAGHKVIREGTPGSELWVVISGDLTVSRDGDTVDTLGPGDFFGELAVIDPAPRNATITADTAVELVAIDGRRFWALMEQAPPVARKLMVHLARRVREHDAQPVSG